MDRILPIDLARPRLRKSFRGYDVSAVDDLLQQAAKSLESFITENVSLREQNEKFRQELDGYRSQDTILRDTLVVAQKTADETRSVAQKHADAILEEARSAALAERMSVQQKVSELRWDLERLKSERQRFSDDFKVLIDRYSREIALLSSANLSVIEGEIESAAAQA